MKAPEGRLQNSSGIPLQWWTKDNRQHKGMCYKGIKENKMLGKQIRGWKVLSDNLTKCYVFTEKDLSEISSYTN